MKPVKRFLFLALAVILALSLCTVGAFADNASPSTESVGEMTRSTTPAPETETPTPAETAESTASHAPIPTAEPTPATTEAPTEEPAPTEAPEIGPPDMEGPGIDEPYGDGIVMGPDNPPEDAPMVFVANSNSAAISVHNCFMSNGTQIKYVSSFYWNNHYIGGNGSPRYQITANGAPAYCIEPGAYLPGGSQVTKDAAKVWAGFPSAKRDAIKVALLCGEPGNSSNLSGNFGSRYTATQMIVWEFVVGVRSTSPPYALSDSKVINAVCSGGANSEVKTVYDQISSAMSAYNTLPSFANPLQAPPPQNDLQYDNGTYSLTLTDSNNVLGNYNVSCTDSNVKLSVNGNKLTMTSTAYISGATVNLTRKSTVSASSQIVAYAGAGLQETVVGVEAVGGTPGYFSIKSAYIPKGSAKIVKTSSDGKVAGITFTVTGPGTSKTVTTGSDGTFTLNDLTPGTYTVTETVPAGYTVDKASQTVTVEDGQTTIVTFRNTLKAGNIKIVKTSDDGVVSGITFRVQGGTIDQRVQSQSDGTITVPGLVPGNYTVTEEVPEGYVCENPSQSVQVQYNTTATVTFQNKLKTGDLKIVKQSDDGVVSGITFRVKGGKIDQTVKSGTDGTITVPGLIPGSYEVTEEVSENYVCDNPKQTVQVEYNKTATVTFNNVLKKWKATVTKVDSEGVTKRGGGATLEGAVYGLYRNGELQATYTTDANGQFTTDTYVCGSGWTIQEREPPTGYTLDPTVYEVGAEPGDFTIASNSLEMTVTERIIKAKLQILKQDKYTLEPLAGASFRVYDESDNIVADGTTGEDGTFLTGDLPYMHYRWQEYEAPEGYQLDDTMHEFFVDTDAVIIEAVQDDLRIPGSITIHKTDTNGTNLSGAMYLLEYSTGGAWQPVTYREGDNVTEGGCTSQGLTNGQLTSGSDGIVTFTGLRADKSIQYRLTETRAPAGTSLLKDPIYVGTLPAAGETGDEYEYDISFSIVNNKVTTLPQTGGTGLLLPVAAGFALAGMAMCAGIYFITKKSKENYL